MIRLITRKIVIIISLVLLLFIPFISRRIREGRSEQTDSLIFPYNLTHPSWEVKLPHSLDEISGLAYFGQDKFGCIQDEKGTIYIFDIQQGKVTAKFKFGDEIDYEDIQIVGKSAYILQSNGTIIEVENFTSVAPEVKKYNTKLSGKNNTEGLAFDDKSNTLLIACKDSPHLKKKNEALKGKKVIYAFDLYTKKISKKPVFIIDPASRKDVEEQSSIMKFFKSLFKVFDSKLNDLAFLPSGLAVHPKTKNIFIISSVEKTLIVLDRAGRIILTKNLSEDIFRQPEGICFNPQGDLFISNERKGGRANILRFNYSQ